MKFNKISSIIITLSLVVSTTLPVFGATNIATKTENSTNIENVGTIGITKGGSQDKGLSERQGKIMEYLKLHQKLGWLGGSCNKLSIVDYGAIANDELDDLTAINECIAAAKLQGKTVYVPRGLFIYSDMITLDGVDMTGEGTTSILKCTNPNVQAIKLTGNGTDLSKVKLTTIPVTVRLSTDNSVRVLVYKDATNFSIKNIEIDGGTSGGIFCTGAHGMISSNTVKNTLADGIHITGLANDLIIKNNRCIDTGDDQIAIVSYDKNGGWVKNVTIINNNVSGGLARGITISGGENVLVENNKIADNGGAGIFIASEGNWRTYTVKNVTVRNNTISNDSINGSVAEKGGIRLQATFQNPSIDTVLIEKNTISGSNDSGIMIVGTATIVNTKFENNTILNAKYFGINIVKTVVGDINFEDNIVTGSGKAAYANYSSDEDIISDMENGAGPGEDPGANSFAVNGTPVIDGIVDDLWVNSTKLQMDTSAQGTTGTAKVVWDETALYFLFEMTDSTPFALSEKERNDSVEVYVDELNAKNGPMGVGDYMLRVDLNNVVTSVIEGMDLTKVVSAVSKGEGMYTVEFSVPYTALSPEIDKIIGFNATANDDSDGDGLRNNYISWVDKNLPYWADTKVYNEVILKGSPE